MSRRTADRSKQFLFGCAPKHTFGRGFSQHFSQMISFHDHRALASGLWFVCSFAVAVCVKLFFF